MLIELNCFLGGTAASSSWSSAPAALFPRGDTNATVPGGAKETMLIKRRDKRLFSQTTTGSTARLCLAASPRISAGRFQPGTTWGSWLNRERRRRRFEKSGVVARGCEYTSERMGNAVGEGGEEDASLSSAVRTLVAMTTR